MSSIASSAGIVSFEQARRLIEQHVATVSPGAVETVDLLGGSERVLAEGIFADATFLHLTGLLAMDMRSVRQTWGRFRRG